MFITNLHKTSIKKNESFEKMIIPRKILMQSLASTPASTKRKEQKKSYKSQQNDEKNSTKNE